MSIRTLMATAIAVGMIISTAAHAQDRATAPEAEAMVKKAVAFIKSNGTDKGYAEISNKTGQFVDRDLYILVHDLSGKCLAHGANQKLIGKEMIDIQDADGKFYMKERMELAKSNQTFWQDYKFTNPVTKKIEPKRLYCERVENTTVCGGIYKPS